MASTHHNPTAARRIKSQRQRGGASQMPVSRCLPPATPLFSSSTANYSQWRPALPPLLRSRPAPPNPRPAPPSKRPPPRNCCRPHTLLLPLDLLLTKNKEKPPIQLDQRQTGAGVLVGQQQSEFAWKCSDVFCVRVVSTPLSRHSGVTVHAIRLLQRKSRGHMNSTLDPSHLRQAKGYR